MASRKRKTIGFRTEEELADAVNEIVNDSDSDTGMISHAETLLKVCYKFQVFISYSFRVIIFLLKS